MLALKMIPDRGSPWLRGNDGVIQAHVDTLADRHE